MAHINPEEVLTSLGFRVVKRAGKYLLGYCPDHHHYTGKYPSHPKWRVNVTTGETYCYTESRKSSLVFVIARALQVSNAEAYRLLSQSSQEIPSRLRFAIETFRRKEPDAPVQAACEPDKNETLLSMRGVFAEGYRSQRLLDYFKRSGGITPETLASFGVVESKGKYHDRAIIPFYDTENVLVGFVAVDLLGERAWVRQSVERVKRHLRPDTTYAMFLKLVRHLHLNYKKALYCPGMSTGTHLFGLERILANGVPEKVILVEGEKDAMKLQQEGFPAVGTHGAHCTEGQRKLLKDKGIKHVIVAFDGDRAGWTSSPKAVAALKATGIDATEVKLPEGRDPKHYDRTTFTLLLDNKECQQQEGLLNPSAQNTLLRFRKWRTQ